MLRTPLHHSRVPIPILGSQHRAATPPLPSPPFLVHLAPSAPPILPPSLSPSRVPIHRSLCLLPLPFLFLLSGLPPRSRTPASVICLLVSLSLSLPLCLPPPFACRLSMPRGLTVPSLAWRAHSTNHPYWPNDPPKRLRDRGRHKNKMRRREQNGSRER